MLYTALGDKDQAMVWLEKRYEERFNPPVSCCVPASIRPGPTASKTWCAALDFHASLVRFALNQFTRIIGLAVRVRGTKFHTELRLEAAACLF